MVRFAAVYFKEHKSEIGIWVLISGIFIGSFALYHLPMEAVLYPAGLSALAGVLFLLISFSRAYRKHRYLRELQNETALLLEELPKARTVDDADYQQLIEKLRKQLQQMESRMNSRYTDMLDYYTLWVHQIKTPIAAMRLNLQNEDSELSRRVMEDLLRVEQYVEMVLCYLRLDADSTDYVIREYELDEIVKQAVKRFAGQFIRRKIQLVYEPLTTQVITDEKWLLFVIEQVLSNALKYTEKGKITIEMEEPKTLCIHDTGIGIAPEDLPRVFEKGYTGYNGRSDKKASGIGLYLCKRICTNLGHGISISSSFDSGTVVRIYLEQRKLGVE